jgi:hypothetical protein
MVGLSCGLAIFLAILPSGGLFDILGMNSSTKARVAVSLASWAFLVPVFFLESGIYWIRKSWGIRDTQGRYPKPDTWARIGRGLVFIGLAISIVTILSMLLLIAAEIVIFGIALFADPASLIQPLLIVGGILIIYLVIRTTFWIVWRLVGKKAVSQISLGLAKYKLIEDGVEIDLNFALQIGKPGPSRFCVRFDELEEVRNLTYVEAVAYMEYTVGPNVELSLREKRELYEWRTGKIPRPTVYILNSTSGLGKKVLLRGPDLFYLISFHAEDVGDLLKAFQRSKLSSIRAAYGSAALPSK